MLMVAAAVQLGLLVWAVCGSDFRIHDAQKDIRELDVGDLDDMTAEVTPAFLEKLRSARSPKPLAASPQQKMVFVVMSVDWTIKNKKRGTDKLSSDWTTMLSLGGLNFPIYSIDPGRLVLAVDTPDDLFELRKFLLAQPDVDFVEVDQKPFYPNGRAQPLLPLEERARLEKQHGLRDSPLAGSPAAARLKPVKTDIKKNREL